MPLMEVFDESVPCADVGIATPAANSLDIVPCIQAASTWAAPDLVAWRTSRCGTSSYGRRNTAWPAAAPALVGLPQPHISARASCRHRCVLAGACCWRSMSSAGLPAPVAFPAACVCDAIGSPTRIIHSTNPRAAPLLSALTHMALLSHFARGAGSPSCGSVLSEAPLPWPISPLRIALQTDSIALFSASHVSLLRMASSSECAPCSTVPRDPASSTPASDSMSSRDVGMAS